MIVRLAVSLVFTRKDTNTQGFGAHDIPTTPENPRSDLDQSLKLFPESSPSGLSAAASDFDTAIDLTFDGVPKRTARPWLPLYLDKDIQERVLRHALVKPGPTLVGGNPIIYTYIPPVPLMADHHITGIATRVFLCENVFQVENVHDLHIFYSWAAAEKNANLVSKIAFDCNGRPDRAVAALKRFKGLQQATIGANERAFVQEVSKSKDGYQECSMRPQDIGFQLNLIILRANAMDAFRELRIPKVVFSPLIHDSMLNIPCAKRTTRPIPGGVFETIVAKEIMQPKAAKPSNSEAAMFDSPVPKLVPPTQPFWFKELSAELRNRIYQAALVHVVKINPSKRLPTSYYKARPRVLIRDGPIPESSLALPQVDRQTFRKAVGIYYSANMPGKTKSQTSRSSTGINSRVGLNELEIVLGDISVFGQRKTIAGWQNMKDLVAQGVKLSLRNQTVDTFLFEHEEDSPLIHPDLEKYRQLGAMIV
ncbi:hypothetical protein K469DRAFT_754662 [Zopfia rhizophila CBS 207.26]|uniref:Uncharacterized protein n=1 Tax=Zopfia rhizophila CBS 207.26 TaxID=1314779 RepID=A0A6A6DFY4_9PEZI|nr:hypothetical protein K469DRAFT_754662 [Zopfia rhizophila CBS 207.26]